MKVKMNMLEKSINEEPLLTVVIISYFQEKYIKHAIESVLIQKTNFPFEILIGDDASTDATPNIIKKLADENQERITAFLRQKNLGASKNLLDLFHKAKGKYIATLEGDDYWTDPNKLQVQVDFLEKNKEYIGCAHKCVVVDENEKPNYNLSPHWTYPKKVFNLNDFLKSETCPSQTGTEVFRNIFSDKNKNYSALYKVHPIVADKTLALMLLSQGDFYCFNKVMSAYRYIIKKDGKNWFSIHHSNSNWQYDAFMRPVKLERYAKSIGIDAKIGPKRDYHYTSLVDNITKEPNLTRVKNLSVMTVKSREPVHCLGLIAKYLILK